MESADGESLIWLNILFTVAALKMNETLKELFIGDNKLMSTDGVQVGNLLKFNHKLELLDLRNNHLQVRRSQVGNPLGRVGRFGDFIATAWENQQSA